MEIKKYKIEYYYEGEVWLMVIMYVYCLSSDYSAVVCVLLPFPWWSGRFQSGGSGNTSHMQVGWEPRTELLLATQ